MGDRANVYVHEGDEPGVYLYTHYDGHELPEIVREALVRGQDRWTDQPYLARIILDDMTRGSRSTRGYGISAQVGDGADRIVDVDTERQVVTTSKGERSWAFAEYIRQSQAHWS